MLFLTARDATEDKVRGLTLGGDDYLVKPFSLEELVARAQAVLRRSGLAQADTVLRLADLELDDDAHRVRRAGEEVALSPTEYNLLRFLLVNQGRVMSKAQILDHVWQYDFGGDGGVVETYIGYLRRKVDNVDPRLIHTIRGVGLHAARAAVDVPPRPPRAGHGADRRGPRGHGGRHHPDDRGEPDRPGRRPPRRPPSHRRFDGRGPGGVGR